jgi:UDP-N-acetylmuramoylalanine--D-glutamate ligase
MIARRAPSFDRQALEGLLGRSVHIVGLAGSEGTAITRFLSRAGVSDITVHDVAEGEALRRAFSRSNVGLPRKQRDELWRELEALPLKRRLGEDYLTGIEQADVLFAGQAWYLYERNRKRLEPLLEAGVPLLGLMDLYFGLAPARILAVTGSNGKSTTSRLVEHVMRAAGLRVWYAGNERRSVQVLDRLDEMAPDDWLVLEVSNRHLRGLRLPAGAGAEIAVVTNVLPNHLDEHGGTMAGYAAVKRRLVADQPAGGIAVLNAEDATTLDFAIDAPGDCLLFSREEPPEAGAWLDEGRLQLLTPAAPDVEDLGPVDAARLPGTHNQSNVLAAVLAARAAGASADAIREALPSFRGLRHRIQFVWGAEGVSYYDDLNATTPLATVAALRALGKDVVLIIGGDDKGLALDELGTEILARVARLVVLPGPGGARIAEAVLALRDGASLERPVIDHFEELAPAIRSVVSEAQSGQTVLLSPACPYFFRRFYIEGAEERGFRALLREATAQVAETMAAQAAMPDAPDASDAPASSATDTVRSAGTNAVPSAGSDAGTDAGPNNSDAHPRATS